MVLQTNNRDHWPRARTFIYIRISAMYWRAVTKYLTTPHRRSQDFVCGGALFFAKKLTTFFSRRRLNIPPNLSHPAKTPKNWLLLWLGGALRVLRGCTYTFFLLIRPENNFFSPPWGGAGAPTAPPGYAYVTPRLQLQCVKHLSLCNASVA